MPDGEHVKIRQEKKGEIRRMYKTAYAVVPNLKKSPIFVEEGGAGTR